MAASPASCELWLPHSSNMLLLYMIGHAKSTAVALSAAFASLCCAIMLCECGLWPAQVPPGPPKPVAPKMEPAGPVDLRPQTMRSAVTTAAGLGSIIALGFASPGPAFSSMVRLSRAFASMHQVCRQPLWH